MKKAKVLMVHNFYQIGGGEHTVFENEKKLLKDNGHEVIEYTRHNNEIKGVKGKVLIPFITIFNFRTYFEIKKIIKKEGIDVMHCHNTFPIISPAAYYAAKSLNIPVVQTIHNFRLLCPNGVFYKNGSICEECLEIGLGKSISNKCYRSSKLGTIVVASMLKFHRVVDTYNKKVDKYITLTDFNKNKLAKIVNEELITIKPNFVHCDKVDNTKQVNEKKNFIFVGRLDPEKGIKFLLEAWSKIKNEKLIIIGDGPLRGYVKNCVNEKDNIEYLGTKSHQQVLEMIKNSKAYVFTSEIYEGFPMVIVEAMSQGTPILCPNIGNGMSIVENNKTGLHYRLNDIDDFIDKINYLILDKNNEKYGKSAKICFEEKYNAKINYKKLNDIYNEVMKNV